MGTTTTKSSAHTPSPWYYEANDRGFRIFTHHGSKDGLIAQLSTFRKNVNWYEEYVPNARLIAAAPELFEVASALYDALADQLGETTDDELSDRERYAMERYAEIKERVDGR